MPEAIPSENTKQPVKKVKRKPGRPSKLSQAIIDKLEQAFSMGCTDPEACLYANISLSTLYDWQQQFPNLVLRKNLLKQSPVLKARSNLIRDLKSGDSVASRWTLERLAKSEFSLRTEQTGINGGPIVQASIEVDTHTPEAAAKAYAELIK